MVWQIVAISLMLGAQNPQAESAAEIVRHALAAVEGDSGARVLARWEARVARDSADRVARLGVAMLHQLNYDDTLTIRLYRSLLAPGTAEDQVAGYAALQLSLKLLGLGRWISADSLAFRAVAIGHALHDAALTGESFVTLALTRHRTVGAPAALPLLDSAEAILAADAWRARGNARCTRAQIFSFTANPRAIPEASAGLELAQRSGDFRTQATCRRVIAGELSRRGDLDSATRVYYRLVVDSRAARDRAGLAVALQWRSHLYRLVGWMAKARRDAEEAIVEAEASGQRATIPWAQTTLAWVALQLGDLATATPHAQEATRQFLAQGDRYSAVIARALESSIAARSGDLEKATESARDALAGAEALHWADAEVQTRLALMNHALQRGDLVEAERQLTASTTRARAAGMGGFVRSSGYFRGVLALRGGRFAEAERIFRGRLASATVLQPNWMYLDRARLAESLARLGRAREALVELTAASQAMDNWRLELRDRDLRLHALQLSEDGDPDLGIATTIRAIAVENETGAFEAIERVRGRDLADRLTRAAASAADTADRVVRSAPPIAAVDLMRVIPESTALLRYVTGRGGEPSTLLTLTWREWNWYAVPPEDSLAPVIARFTALIESGEDTRALARQLGAALVQRPLRYLHPSVTRLIIVPDGVLSRVPFDALLATDSTYVVERYAISYAPSATVAAASFSTHRAAPAATLVMADPRFAHETRGPAPGADVFRGAVAGRGALPRLPGSAREAQAVARYSDAATVRRRSAASEAWIKGAPLSTFGVVHFATHALVDDASITSTALALAPGAGEDGFVNAGELLGLRLAADLVVLSACRTAGGPLVRGEGVQGLATPLLIAGARAVVATWWPISDQTNVRLVDDFYHGLASGLPATEALRAAKVGALHRGAPTREWAAFTIIGDPMVRPALRLPRQGLPVALLAALVGSVALWAYGAATRRRRTVDAR